MTTRKIPVLIVGAGFAGLTAALLLAWRGIPCLLVERRSAPSRHPRAHGLNPRSLELLRVVPGLEKDLRNASRAEFNDFTIVIAESVSGREIGTLTAPGGFEARLLSPAEICSAGQDRLEPILLAHARAHGAKYLAATELVELHQDAEGVVARLRDLASGTITEIMADFAIAADGARSLVRQSLGIATHGPGTLAHSMSILFEADLGVAMRNRSFVLYYLQNPEFVGTFVSSDDKDRGQIDVDYDPILECASEIGRARCQRLVRAALGMPDLDVTVLEVTPWEVSAFVADRMTAGRVFLTGDAAHAMPSDGGLGGQAAIQDAADLAWKLAMVVENHAGLALLETYEAERHPVARLTTTRQLANWAERMHPDLAGRSDLIEPAAQWDNLGVALGYRYRSAAILSDATDDGEPIEDPREPSGSPGTRLAHVPLVRNGAIISTHDLVGRGFVLLAGPEGGAWTEAARTVAARTGVPLDAFRIGTELIDSGDTFLRRAGLGPDGALLVRPDGFIAWRSASAAADPTTIVESVLARILGKDLAGNAPPI